MKLSQEQIEERLSTITDWEMNEQGEIEKTFHFNSYIDGIHFSTEIGHFAERHNHHPELCVLYKKVVIKMKSHDEDGLTERDFSLAHAIERQYSF